MQDVTEELRKLEQAAEQLKLTRVRIDERLLLLRKERDMLMKELEDHGISPKDATKRLGALADSIDQEIKAIKEQIPPNLEELLDDRNNPSGTDV